MLKIDTKVEIISKTIGVNIKDINYNIGYINDIRQDGKTHGYIDDFYYSVWYKKNNYGRGDHFLECDLINNHLPEELFEI